MRRIQRSRPERDSGVEVVAVEHEVAQTAAV
jgi:hypothetical protein